MLFYSGAKLPPRIIGSSLEVNAALLSSITSERRLNLSIALFSCRDARSASCNACIDVL